MTDDELHAARILVVDDDEANVDLLEQMLRQAGYTNVVSTTDARRVLPLFLELPPDLILLDLIMPHLDGFGVIAQIAPHIAEGGYLPILVLTADTTWETKRRALTAGARDFLTKPVDRTELLLRIHNLLETRLLYAQLQQRNQLLERLYEQAQESMRLREQLQSVISHDLGQPVSAIRVAARVLQKEQTALDEPARQAAGEYLTLIDYATTRMLAMIGEIVDVSRIQSGQPLDLDYQRVDLISLVRSEVVAQQATTVRHTIEVASGEKELTGEWDRERLTRVLSNLLTNAIKYSPNGGEIVVALRREAMGGRDWAVLEVRDHGIGIPAADLPAIFEPFHRASNALGQIRGTGLGLMSARQIVEQHGGRISIDSEEGVGTAVTVRLPLD